VTLWEVLDLTAKFLRFGDAHKRQLHTRYFRSTTVTFNVTVCAVSYEKCKSSLIIFARLQPVTLARFAGVFFYFRMIVGT